jgi:hypothetical protein
VREFRLNLPKELGKHNFRSSFNQHFALVALFRFDSIRFELNWIELSWIELNWVELSWVDIISLRFAYLFLDFIQEGKNAERVKRNFQNDPEFTAPDIEWVSSNRFQSLHVFFLFLESKSQIKFRFSLLLNWREILYVLCMFCVLVDEYIAYFDNGIHSRLPNYWRWNSQKVGV